MDKKQEPTVRISLTSEGFLFSPQDKAVVDQLKATFHKVFTNQFLEDLYLLAKARLSSPYFLIAYLLTGMMSLEGRFETVALSYALRQKSSCIFLTVARSSVGKTQAMRPICSALVNDPTPMNPRLQDIGTASLKPAFLDTLPEKNPDGFLILLDEPRGLTGAGTKDATYKLIQLWDHQGVSSNICGEPPNSEPDNFFANSPL